MPKIFAAMCAALVAAPLIGFATDVAAQGAQSGGSQVALPPGVAEAAADSGVAAADSGVAEVDSVAVDFGIATIFGSAASFMVASAPASVFMILGTTRSGDRDLAMDMAMAMASTVITRLRLA